MGIFDVFGASAPNTLRPMTQGLNQGYNLATGAVNSGTANARNDITGNNAEARNFYNTYGYDVPLNALQEGRQAAQGFYQQALSPWQQLSRQGNRGINLYGRLAGVNGPEDMSATLAQIPGYQFALNQGLDSVNRLANSRGMLASGNNTQDLNNYAQGQASQNYFNYLNSLQPYFGLGQNAAQGMQSVYNTLGNNWQNYGQQEAALAQQYGNNRAALEQGQGQNLADLSKWQGGSNAGYGWNYGTGLGQAGADQAVQNYNASQAGSQNLWNALLGLGGLATNVIGMV